MENSNLSNFTNMETNLLKVMENKNHLVKLLEFMKVVNYNQSNFHKNLTNLLRGMEQKNHLENKLE